MLQFHLAKNLIGDMAMHMQPSNVAGLRPQHWYLQRTMVLRRKCVIAMEQQSRYALIFCGLTRKDFINFPALFKERLWRDVLAICQLNDRQSARLAELVLSVSAQQIYAQGSDRSVQAHLKDANWTLDYLAHRAGTLPQSGDECFAAGIHINETLRSIGGSKDYIVPLEVFRDSWLGLLERSSHAAVRPS